MATNDWVAAGAGNWSTAGNWSLGHKPSAGEDVTMGGGSDQNCVVDEASAAVNSLNMTGYSGVLSGSFNITVTVASGTSTVLFAGSPTWTGTLNLNPAAGTTINLTMGSLTTAGTIGGITIAGTTTGKVSFQDAVTIAAAKIMTLTSGTLETDGGAGGLTHSWGRFSSDNSNTRTLTLGNSTVNLTGGASNGIWNIYTGTGLTISNNTSTVNLSGTGAGFTSGTLNYNGMTLNFTGSGTGYLAGNITVYCFSRIGTNVKTDSMNLTTGFSATNSLTFTGYSATSRILVYSSTLGTARTITCSGATISCANVDFRDITFARSDSGALDLSAGQTHSVGDCGGNSKTLGDSSTLTFTTAAPQTWDGTTANADVAARWTSRVPLPQDNIIFAGINAGNGTCTYNMPRMGKDISFTVSPDTTKKVTLNLANAVTSYGSLDFTGAGALGGAFGWTFESQERSGTKYLTSAGKTFVSNVSIAVFNSTLQCLDAFSQGDGYFNFNNGTFDFNDFSSSNGKGVLSNGSGVRSLYMGNGTFTLSATDTIWSFTGATNFNFYPEYSTIAITNSGATYKDWSGGSKTYYNLTIPSGTGGVTISGSNSFNSIQAASGGLITLTANTTQTITGSMSTGFGNGTNVLTLAATAGVVPIINKTGGGIITADHLNIQGVNVTPANTWYYGTHSTDGIGLFFDGTNDVVTFGNLGNITNVTLNMIMRVDDNEILTVNGATNGSVKVAAGVLTFGAALSGSNILVDGVSKTAAQAGALLNDNLNHTLAFDLTSIAASDFRLGTDSSAYGELFVNGLTATGHSWTFAGSTVTDTVGANNGTITGALWANTGWNAGSNLTMSTNIILGKRRQRAERITIGVTAL